MAVRQLRTLDPEQDLAEASARVVELERQLADARLRREQALVKFVMHEAKQEAAPMSRLLSPKHVASLLDMDESTIWRAISSGELKSRTIGRSRRIALADLERWTQA